MLSYEEIFNAVAKRIKARRESLRGLARWKGKQIGIESWLKVEALRVLGDKVRRVYGKGPDLELENNIRIELKAATDFNLSYILQGAKDAPCLFLADGNDLEKIQNLESDETTEIIGFDIFEVDGDKWVIGMIRRSRSAHI